MAINTSQGGIMKPVAANTGILWFAEAGEVEVSAITAVADLETLGLKSAGAITTEGVTLAENPTDPETYNDWSGNTFDSSEATSSPSISFALLEVLNPEAAKLVFNSSAIKEAGGELTAIEGSANPSNKLIVIDTRIKNRRIRAIYPEAAFASRGDNVYANDALYSWSVTYNLLTDSKGNDRYSLYSDLVVDGGAEG